MVTAFVDMMGGLIVFPLVPFIAKKFNGHGPIWQLLDSIGMGGDGAVVSLLVVAFAVAQLVASPFWGRFSDKIGRRPALMIALGSSAIAYVIFAFSQSLEMLFLCRIVQGAGGGTVGVVQAYVADATKPEDRAKALGWLSAATNAGVAIGPAIGAFAMSFGDTGPGLMAAAIAGVNMVFCWFYLKESNVAVTSGEKKAITKSGDAVKRVVSHPGEPASRLIWIYAITMGSFQGMTTVLALLLAANFGVTQHTIGYFFAYVGVLSVVSRAFVLGRMVDHYGEAKLSRFGMVLLAAGLATMPLTSTLPMLALSVALIPLGTAFTFPCVTGLLSRIVPNHERGLYMGVQQTFGGISRVVGPIYAGWAFDHLGHGVPFYTAGGIVIATIFLGLDMDKYVPARVKAAA
jgi:multidrug resistance protein